MKKKLTKEMEELLKTLTICELTEEGYELHNPIPLDVPIPLKAGPTLKMRIAALMRQNAVENHVESLEESMDLNVGDDMVQPSDDTQFMVPDGPTELEQAAAEQNIPLTTNAADEKDPEPTIQSSEQSSDKEADQ